jgi:hypothetical protein
MNPPAGGLPDEPWQDFDSIFFKKMERNKKKGSGQPRDYTVKRKER